MKPAEKVVKTGLWVPQLAWKFFRHGVVPTPTQLFPLAKQEGFRDLHWKLLGDGLARSFRESGPVVAKFGQILAARGSLLSPVVSDRLESLYSSQKPMSTEEFEEVMRRAYPGGPPFRDWDPIPLAVGSVGQVHRGTLLSGDKVVIKLLRPGTEKRIREDVEALTMLLDLSVMFSSESKRASWKVLTRSFEDLGQRLLREADLSNEVESLDEFRERFRSNSQVKVPVCFKQFCSREVLVMEELEGESLSEIRKRAQSDPETAKKLASLALKEILRQIFDEGRFHGDPHGGNLLLLKDGRLGLIDLGLVGELGSKERRHISKAIRAFLTRDPDAVIKALLGFGETPENFDFERFRDAIRKTVQTHKDKKSGEESSIGLEELVGELFSVSARHGIYVPESSSLIVKTLVTIEGVARGLDPDINFVSTATPVILESLTPKWLRFVFRRSA